MYLTKQVTDMLDVSAETLRRMVADGALPPPEKHHNRLRWDRAAIDRVVAKRENSVTTSEACKKLNVAYQTLRRMVIDKRLPKPKRISGVLLWDRRSLLKYIAPDGMVNISDLCAFMGLTETSLWKAVKRGEIEPPIKIGRQTWWPSMGFEKREGMPVEDVVRILGVTRMTLYRWARSGRLPPPPYSPAQLCEILLTRAAKHGKNG